MSTPSLVVDQAIRPGEDVVQTHRRTIRVDIQVLRALAIILVLAHHARLPFVPAGFLGVDIFFVISGFLMGGLIDEGLDRGVFSFGGFYARRARRLLPASYATLVVTAIAAPFVIDSGEYRAFVGQLAGSFGFVANMVLWKQSNYFSSGAALKALLHMWSLSIEEQFYLVLPLLLALARPRARVPVILVATIASAALCWLAVQRAPSAAFYLAPTRVWELGIGVLLAMLVRRGIVPPRPMVAARAAAVVLLMVVPMIADEGGHPGWPALAVCLATALLLVPGGDAGPRLARRLTPLRWIGDRSYSLYLVHWPLFAFANNMWIEPVPLAVNLALLAGGVLLAMVQYRAVEQPLRRIAFSARAIVLLVAVPLVTVGVSAVVAHRIGAPAAADRQADPGLSGCASAATPWTVPTCRTAPHPRIAVLGDSFAMAAAPGIAATAPGGMLQLTKTFCGPFLDIAATDRTLYPPRWGEGCIAFNRAAVAALSREPSVKTVVLSSVLVQYLPDAEPGLRLLRHDAGGAAIVGDRSPAALAAALSRTVAALHVAGKRVVLLAPPPSVDEDLGRCVLRRMEHLATVAPPGDCTLSVARYRQQRRAMLAFLMAAEVAHIVPVARLDQALCDQGRCLVAIGPMLLYADHAHLSARGSVFVARRSGWTRALEAAAR